MPFDEVMHKFGEGNLHSGSKTGEKVTNPKQAVAIMLAEKRKAAGGKSEYASHAMKGLKAAKPKAKDPDHDGDNDQSASGDTDKDYAGKK